MKMCSIFPSIEPSENPNTEETEAELDAKVTKLQSEREQRLTKFFDARRAATNAWIDKMCEGL